jgi:hypothetical protein
MADKQPYRLKNLTMAAIAAQAGCATLIIVVSALIGGLWLDQQAGQRGPFVIGLLVISVPISLFVMLRITLGAIKRITPQLPLEARFSESSESSEEV